MNIKQGGDYILEEKTSGGLFKADNITRNRVTMEYRYDKGNANPPTGMFFHAPGSYEYNRVSVSHMNVRLNTWYESKNSSPPTKWRIVRA
jgi:hypothetical protein